MNLDEAVIGGYRLRTRLGAWRADRAVYAAESPTGRAVLKLAPLDESGVFRLAEEFAKFRQLAGPGVAVVLGHGVHLDPPAEYLVLQAEGPSLAAILEQTPGRMLDPELALAATHATAVALAALHQRGYCHGDVKPGNILLTGSGAAVLTDVEFSLPILRDAPPDLHFAGTPPFVAPEVWEQGRAAIGPASDVWSLGVVLFLALTGQYPFGTTTGPELIERIREGCVPELPGELPSAVRDVAARLLTTELTRRPADGAAAVEVLAEALRQIGSEHAAARLGELVRVVPQYAALYEVVTLTDPGPVSGEKPEGGSEPATGEGLRPAAEVPTAEGLLPLPPAHTIDQPAPQPPGAIPPGAAAPPPPPLTSPLPPPSDEELELEIITRESLAPARAERLPETEPPAGALRRRAAARWFIRMNPHRHFPVSVVISGKQIRITAAAGMEVAVGKAEFAVSPDDPTVEVEPCFPGCLVSPPRGRVDVTPETVSARFFVTPLAEGPLPEACVRVFHQGRLVEELPTPTVVVKRTIAYVLMGSGVIWPVVARGLEALQLSPGDVIPLMDRVIGWFGPTASAVLVAGLLLLAGVVAYRMTRPLEADEPPLFTASPDCPGSRP